MPKFKGKASRNKSPSGPRGGGSTGGYSGCDSLLVPRVAEYARSNDLADVDDVVEHLRGCPRVRVCTRAACAHTLGRKQDNDGATKTEESFYLIQTLLTHVPQYLLACFYTRLGARTHASWSRLECDPHITMLDCLHLQVQGHGPHKPIATDFAQRRRNRRVEFLVL